MVVWGGWKVECVMRVRESVSVGEREREENENWKPTHTKFFLSHTHTLTHPYSFSYPIFLTCPKIKQLGELDMNMYVIEVYENVHNILT